MEEKLNACFDLHEKILAIAALRRVIETTGAIDADDFYICTGIKVTKDGTGEAGVSTGKTIEEYMHDYYMV